MTSSSLRPRRTAVLALVAALLLSLTAVLNAMHTPGCQSYNSTSLSRALDHGGCELGIVVPLLPRIELALA